MEEKSRTQELSVREISLIRELAQIRKEHKREAGTTSIPIPQREESENIPLPDLPGQLENVQQSGNEIAERGMPT